MPRLDGTKHIGRKELCPSPNTEALPHGLLESTSPRCGVRGVVEIEVNTPGLPRPHGHIGSKRVRSPNHLAFGRINIDHAVVGGDDDIFVRGRHGGELPAERVNLLQGIPPDIAVDPVLVAHAIQRGPIHIGKAPVGSVKKRPDQVQVIVQGAGAFDIRPAQRDLGEV